MTSVWTWNRQVGTLLFAGQGAIDEESVSWVILKPKSLQRIVFNASSHAGWSSNAPGQIGLIPLGTLTVFLNLLVDGVSLSYYAETVPESASQVFVPTATPPAGWTVAIHSAWPFRLDALTRHANGASNQPDMTLTMTGLFQPVTPFSTGVGGVSRGLDWSMSFLTSEPGP